jgi:hypothetical protein
VVRIRTCNGDRLFRIGYVLRRTCGCGATAGLRQPLLVARAQVVAMRAGALQRRFVSHGGLTPPALVLQCACLPAKSVFSMRKRTPARAAGVSPPWFGFALATATGFFGLNTFCAAHADVVPRLAYASCSCVARRLFDARCATCNAQACVQPGAAGVSPPWFRDTNVVQRETRFVQRLANGRTRAAEVSHRGSNSHLQRRPAFSD